MSDLEDSAITRVDDEGITFSIIAIIFLRYNRNEFKLLYYKEYRVKYRVGIGLGVELSACLSVRLVIELGVWLCLGTGICQGRGLSIGLDLEMIFIICSSLTNTNGHIILLLVRSNFNALDQSAKLWK